jgi:hypothetical protein
VRAALAASIVASACASPAREPIAHEAIRHVTGDGCTLATPRRTPTPIAFYQRLGEVAGRTWFLGRRDQGTGGDAYVLATLDDDGALAVTPLPPDRYPQVDVILDGTRAWLVVKHRAGLVAGSEELVEADLTTIPARLTPIESLAAKATVGATTFAIGTTRALFFTKAGIATATTWSGTGGLELWDRGGRRPLAAVPNQPAGDPILRCVHDDCFAVGEFEQPQRHLGVASFGPAGAVTHRVLTDDRGLHVLALADGDRTTIVYPGDPRQGLFAQVLDDRGAPVGGESRLLDIVPVMPALTRGPTPHLIWWKGGWSIATFAGDHLAGTHALGLDDLELALAETAQGTWIAAYRQVGAQPGQAPAAALAIYLPHDGAPEPAVDVSAADRSSGFIATPLVAPGHAAMLVERMLTPDPGELVLVRAPCR